MCCCMEFHHQSSDSDMLMLSKHLHSFVKGFKGLALQQKAFVGGKMHATGQLPKSFKYIKLLVEDVKFDCRSLSLTRSVGPKDQARP